MGDHKQKSIPKGRIGRLSMLGGLAGGLATELAATAGRMATGVARDKAAEKFHKHAAQKLLSSLGRMKGLPMKVGQMLSYVDDFIPPEHREIYRNTLKELQVRARPMRFREIAPLFEQDLGRRPDKIFRSFREDPIAAASIGQVYRAELPDGTAVAIKVQYPGIREAIESDLKNLEMLYSALSIILPKVDVERTVADLTARVLEECDYGCELNNQEDFRRVWQNDPEIYIPRTFPELCGDRILVMEYVHGASWHEMLAKASPAERSRLGQIIARFVFHSLYVDAMFNADPHPGNYIFLADGRVAFIDFGCVQRYTEEALVAFRAVRDRSIEGQARGSEFRALLKDAYGLPDDFDEEEWAFMEEYVLACFEPLLAQQPYRYSHDYTQRLADLTMKGASIGARKAMRKGVWEAKRPGLIFLNRINFGLNSLLATLGAEADWQALVRAIDARADQQKRTA